MARLFVFSNDMTTRAEIVQDDETGAYRVFCGACLPTDLVKDTHEQSEADAVQVASIHVDQH